MTIKTNYAFKPSDIESISFTCSHCQSTVTVPMNGKSKSPDEASFRCAVCQTPWTNGKELKINAMKALVKGLEEFSRNEDNGFTMEFQIGQAALKTVGL